jgi:hypothetical protein
MFNKEMKMTDTTETVVAGVDGRFFVIQADGTIKQLNESGQYIRWVFNNKASALTAARRQGAQVWDKQRAEWANVR